MISNKKRKLKEIIKDMNLTAIRYGEFKYVNIDMVSEAIEYISNKYYEVQGDMIDDLMKLIKGD